MSKHTIILVLGDRLLDKFMHAADVFESFKRLILAPQEFDVTLKPGHRITTSVGRIRKHFAADQKLFLVAILVKGRKTRWVDPEVKVVSTGYTWCLTGELIATLEEPK